MPKCEDPVIRGVIEAEDAQAAFLPPPNMTLVDAVRLYREANIAADAVLGEMELDSPAVVPWWIIIGTLRWNAFWCI